MRNNDIKKKFQNRSKTRESNLKENETKSI